MGSNPNDQLILFFSDGNGHVANVVIYQSQLNFLLGLAGLLCGFLVWFALIYASK